MWSGDGEGCSGWWRFGQGGGTGERQASGGDASIVTLGTIAEAWPKLW